MRLAGAYDRGEADFARVATPILKYWLTKRSPGHAAEALECLGGNGYVEETGMPRLFRQSPLNSIWEGSGNVICMDVLRALEHVAGAEAFFEELEAALGADARYDRAVESLRREVAAVDEAGARRLTERAAVALQASLLLRYSPGPVADAFVSSRIADPGAAYGSIDPGLDVEGVLTRAFPA